MSNSAIQLNGVGKMYKLYRRQVDKVLDALGMARFIPKFEDHYREFWALRSLNLSISPGERVGIIGRNGSGKSTTLKIISGNTPATEGTVQVNGNVQALMELGTGFHPEFTGRQNIRASLAYHGLSTRRIAALEEEIIDFTELEEFIDQPVKTYSAGMYARLAFSTATSVEPEILIIDEVLGAGDAYFAGKCVERMKRLTEGSGATVLFVSHDLGSVQQLCQRVIWIDRGKIVMDAPPLDVTKAYYASILQQEEVRLRARNAKLSRRLAGQIVNEERERGTRELLCRFIRRPEGPPALAHPVRRITLSTDSGFSLEVEPGSPMDNDPTQCAHVLTDRQYMNWSEPTLINGVRVRCIQNVGGKYLHAPFVFAIPEQHWSRGRFHIIVEHAARAGEEIALEYYHADAYRPLGLLSEGGEWRPQGFDVILEPGPAREESAEASGASGFPPEADRGVQDKWETQAARFEAVFPIDSSGVPREVFSGGETFGFRISANVLMPLAPCWLAVVVYHQSGQTAAHWVQRLEQPVQPGRQTWDLFAESPNLRQGEYVVTIELLSNYDAMATDRLPFYCHWNRCVVFRIDEDYVGKIPLGIVKIPFVIRQQESNDRD